MPFIPTLMCPPLTNSPLPHFMFTDFSFYTFFSPPRFETSLFLSTFGVGVTVLSAPPTPPGHPSIPFFFRLSKFAVHCPPDSHPSTWVQFKKPFNSCHSTGLAISPAAKAQTGTLLQQATLNVRLVPPIPNKLKVKDSISQRLVQPKTGEAELEFRGNIVTSFLMQPTSGMQRCGLETNSVALRGLMNMI